VNAVFFTGTIQYLSAKGADYDLKACCCGVRFKITSSEEVKGFHQMASAYKSGSL
jgi:thiamine pyrophosphokinase